MKNTPLWKTFLLVFVVTFTANTAVVYLWNIFFHDSGFQWSSTTTAVVVAVIMTYILHQKK